MRNLLLALMGVCLMTTLSYAGGSKKSCPDGYKETVTKSGYGPTQCYIDTDTDTDTDTLGEPQDELGVGADVVLWQSSDEEPLIEEVTAEYRRDLENDTNAVYGVVRVNLWSKLRK